MRNINQHDYFSMLTHHIKSRTGLSQPYAAGSYAQGMHDGAEWSWHRLQAEVASLEVRLCELEDECAKLHVKDKVFGILGALDEP